MRKLANALIAAGAVLVAAAIALTGSNILAERRAGDASRRIIEQLRPAVTTAALTRPDAASRPDTPETPDASPDVRIPDYLLDPEMAMPTMDSDGQACIGILDIPALSLTLPVIAEWSYPRLELAPCRYAGSAYLGDLIIMAHNYKTHFGSLSTLRPGDAVRFTDAAGNVFTYAVAETQTLPGDALEDMEAGDWDLTLFTCTVGRESRITVRCVEER